jgi:phosphomannomutase
MAGIFKAYDIRGIVGEGLDAATARLMGHGLAREAFGGKGPILVTRDMRVSSPLLSEALIEGLRDGGCEVLDLGLASTPMHYWANVEYGAPGSVQVTASHNGPEWNGFKVCGPRATPIDYGTGLDRVEAYVRSAASATLPAASSAPLRELPSPLAEYLDFMDRFVEPTAARARIAIDAGNGMAGHFLPAFSARHPWLEIVPLYWELDGTFPNHDADPLRPENLVDLQRAVVEQRCDLGVAFDGDADRCILVDESGTIVPGDILTAFLADWFLRKSPGAAVIYDVRSSRVVRDVVEEAGGRPVRGPVGHTLLKRLLAETGAVFGGELSGHFYFADCFNTDSAILALIETLNAWGAPSNAGRPLSKVMQPYRRYASTPERNFRVAEPGPLLEGIAAEFAAEGCTIDRFDGLTVAAADWWFNLRRSNTEPHLRLNLEARTPGARDAMLTRLLPALTRAQAVSAA